MIRKRIMAAIVFAALVGLIAVFVWKKDSPDVSPLPESKGIQPTEALRDPGPPTHVATLPPDPARVRVAEALTGGVSLLPESRELVAALNQPEETPEHGLEVVENLLATYRSIFGSNPPGGLNREIIAAMLGENSLKLAILARDMTSLSPSGELLDRWGSPFLFHPVSNDVMEVMSAGPDQALWTPDDVGKITPADDAMGL